MNNRQIVLKKVKVHNLKEVDLELDPFELIVFTGVSGSGKSSLAFDTIYVEGQRRYIESLPAALRRYIQEQTKPDAKVISGLSPTIAIEQKTVLKTPRSTVGTMTGIYDFLRVLFSKVATFYCPVSGEIVKPHSKEKIISTIKKDFVNKKIIILCPYIKDKKGSLKDDISDLIKKGFTKVRIDNEIVDILENTEPDPKKEHNLDIVIDRIKLTEDNFSRLKEDINTCFEYSNGSVIILDAEEKNETFFSQTAYSPKSKISYPALTAGDFSFNHPSGMCPQCQGLGEVFEFDIDKIIDPNLSISEDCCKIAGHYNTVRYKNIYDNLARIYNFSVKTPFKDLSKKAKDIFLYGAGDKWIKMKFVHIRRSVKWEEFVKYKGVIYEAHKRLDKATSDSYRKNIQSLMSKMICPSCNGAKIKPYPAAAKFREKTIFDISKFPIKKALDFFENIKLTKEEIVAKDLIFEIVKKLKFLINVGLHYLCLDRISPSLSGGESQRVRLAALIGSGLSGSTYILDEPSIGLHPHDHNKLIDTLIDLKNHKNTVIVVEHDKDTIESADVIVDVGPFAGKKGGEIIAKGSILDIINEKRSLTGQYLSGEKKLPLSYERKISKESIVIKNCIHNNLKNVDLKIPLHNFVCISGVSGSGKSSLISDTLFPALSNVLQKSKLECGKFDSIEGLENIEKVIFVDQSPIGRTIRSNPATYIKLFDDIRNLFANLKQSKAKGFNAGSFSFNVKEGTCPYCKGLGQVKVDMDFLEDVYSTCAQCGGKRFSKEILSIYYKDKNIYDVLNMDIEEALVFFDSIPNIKHKLDLLNQVGLGYIPLGQSATTLSGGEAQRIKLAKELVRPSLGKTIYILDEPTTGLHFHDIKNLLNILQELVNHKNTVIVIEHNMDFIKCADYVIDLGPGSSEEGGKIIASDTPEKIAQENSPTGKALKKAFLQTKYIHKKTKTTVVEEKYLIIENAYQNNLKNIDLQIPHNEITIFTGPSGSGKTSLAFDTIYAEGQIRYIQSLPGYSRQFLSKIPRPNVDKIKNLYPPIALQQKGHLLNPRSTVGTITEIYDHLRLLYSHLGEAFSPDSKEKITTISPEYVAQKVLSFEENEKVQILAFVEMEKNDSFEDFLEKYLSLGYTKLRLNDKYYSFDEEIPFNKNAKNEIFLVIDRIKVNKDIYLRLLEAIKTAAKISNGKLLISKENEDIFFNLAFACQKTGKSYPEITTQTFSFNSEAGMCLECMGLGYIFGFDFLSEGSFEKATILDILYIFFEDCEIDFIEEMFKSLKIDTEKPLKKLEADKLNIFLNGTEKEFFKKNVSYKWKGFNKTLATMAKHSTRNIKEMLIPLMEERTCPSCFGKRLNPLARNVLINKVSITDFCSFSIENAIKFIEKIKLDESQKHILEDVLNHIKSSLNFLNEIGLNYISLDRSAPTLSGGELQRIRLSKQLGSFLTSCIYILDEPTIGLHPHNSHLLANTLKKLKELGNTLILVDHDPQIIEKADYVFDFGPSAGVNGGKILASGTIDEIKKNPKSLTGQYLSEAKKISLPEKRRPINKKDQITIEKARLHNLKNISASIPLNTITCITGVSGCGKSTLIHDILKKAAKAAIKQRKDEIHYPYGIVKGLKNFENIISLDQTPIGSTIRSDVGTYSDLMPVLRSFYSNLSSAKVKGLRPRNFSYNHIQGMCKTCWGLGFKNIQLQYLPPVKITCDACNGLKLNPLSLEVKYQNKNLGQVLDLTIDEAKEFFNILPKFSKMATLIQEVGLGYLKLGQELNSLSGGEAQRIRLAKELAKRRSSKTLYLLDEPTTGLHFVDIEKLLKIFHQLADKKNTLVIIEHNLDIIKNADYIIDLGLDAGENGGEVIFEGSFDDLLKNKKSYTAKYLKSYLSSR
ncbi:MAG: excinuclease ABC subunit UvrA [Parachlamydiales bacterium]|nr:excinuclease ABC subunit UvrA [Parachlamydiales bacterium]